MWREHTRELPDFKIGSVVQVQNQTGPIAKKCQKSGMVTEVPKHQQYSVKVDGSLRVTLRNIRFLNPITPYKPPVTRVAEGSPGLAQGGPREDQDEAKAGQGCPGLAKGSPKRAGVGQNKVEVERPRRAVSRPKRFQGGQ